MNGQHPGPGLACCLVNCNLKHRALKRGVWRRTRTSPSVEQETFSFLLILRFRCLVFGRTRIGMKIRYDLGVVANGSRRPGGGSRICGQRRRGVSQWYVRVQVHTVDIMMPNSFVVRPIGLIVALTVQEPVTILIVSMTSGRSSELQSDGPGS